MLKSADWVVYRRWRMCDRKVKYAHEGQAKRKAHQLAQRAYKCDHCSGYHLTSKIKS